MSKKCVNGHVIAEEQETCEHGHPVDTMEASGHQIDRNTPNTKTAQDGITLTPEQLSNIIQTAIQGALAAHVQPAQAKVHCTTKKPDRPKIDLDSNENQWQYFKHEWNEYKKKVGLTDDDEQITSELRICCSTELRQKLFDFIGGTTLETLNEQTLLEKIKMIAVRGKNKAVHRKEFYSMTQSPEEPIQTFIANLRSKAQHCQFSFRCSSELCNNRVNSYAESMVEDQMVVGCASEDIQEEILARDSQLKNFQDKFDFIEAMEQGRRAKDDVKKLSHVDSTFALQRGKDKRQPKIASTTSHANNNTNNNRKGCSGCGSTQHGWGTTFPRKDNCPAWTKICHRCNIKGHLATVCRSVKRTSLPAETNNFAEHNTITSDPGMSYFLACTQRPIKCITIPHMEWSKQCKSFVYTKTATPTRVEN